MVGVKILALDTSTEWLSVAVYDGHDASVIRERAGNSASERILPLTQRVLADAGVMLKSLGGIGYGAGPGSFTGVRITCGVVQGLALGADLPVFGVPTLGAIAHAAWRRHGWPRVLACLDARMREVYVCSYASPTLSPWPMPAPGTAPVKAFPRTPSSHSGWHCPTPMRRSLLTPRPLPNGRGHISWPARGAMPPVHSRSTCATVLR